MKFTEHARDRMSEFGISEQEVIESIEVPDAVFLDILTGRFIAVKKQTESRALVTVFEKNDDITIVTVFPTSKINKVLESRIKSGRWLEI